MKKKIYLRDNFVLEDFYAAIVQDRLDTVHIPHSDVFYVRKAIEHRTGILYSLEQIEAAMKAEGWRK
jgi:hypothetical protein|tara:strand:- start:254 stop:454 length:201 start_codon:yes stop_codon:yes gene_type:complete